GGNRRAAIQRQRPGQDHLPGEAETVVVGGAQRGHQALGPKADQGGLSMEGASVARGAPPGGDICNAVGAKRPDMSNRAFARGPYPAKALAMTKPVPKDWITGISPYVPGKAASDDGRKLAKLSANENPLGTSPK